MHYDALRPGFNPHDLKKGDTVSNLIQYWQRLSQERIETLLSIQPGDQQGNCIYCKKPAPEHDDSICAWHQTINAVDTLKSLLMEEQFRFRRITTS